MLRKETGRNFACFFVFLKVGNGRDGWINVGKRERRGELDEGEFLLRADGKLDRTASTNNGVQHETTRIEENERKKIFQQKTKMREREKKSYVTRTRG